MGERRVDPAGTTPWDRWNGARVGGLVGAILGMLAALMFDPRPFWLVLVGAAIGAAVGYWSERRKQQ